MAAARTRFGIGIPQKFPDGRVDSEMIRKFIVKAEQLGYHSLWVSENVFGKSTSLDPLVLLAQAAALTSRVRIGSSILISVLRNPVLLAKGLATLDHLCRGRLIVGLGVGGFTQMPFYPAFGIRCGETGARFEEGIRLMERLWTEEVVTFRGRFWDVREMALYPKPFQKPRPPLWFGAHVPAALERAVRLGEGWMGSPVPAGCPFSEELDRVRQHLKESGRASSSYTLSKRVYVALDEDRERAARRLRSWFDKLYREPEVATRASVFGNPEECAQGLARLAAQGVDLLILDPVYDRVQQMERLAREVLPQLREP